MELDSRNGMRSRTMAKVFSMLIGLVPKTHRIFQAGAAPGAPGQR